MDPPGLPKVKRQLHFCPFLTIPDSYLQFVVEVDPRDGWLYPCAFLSKKLIPAEQNDIGNRELLAVKAAFEEWTSCPLLVRSEHNNLKCLHTAKWLNPRQTRWVLFFNPFNFHLCYKPGSKNAKPDAPSHLRASDPVPEEPSRSAAKPSQYELKVIVWWGQ